MKYRLPVSVILAVLACLLAARACLAQTTRIRNLCHVKGQEESVLVGMGLVVGLAGTGDGGDHITTLRSLAQTYSSLGIPMDPKSALAQLGDNKNVALVMVEARVPRQGASEGVKLDCLISSTNGAKSLAGGRLFMTPLVGPLPNGDAGKQHVYAMARGPIQIDPKIPTVGRIYDGCQLVEDFLNPYVKDSAVTLILDKDRAGWEVAQEVTDTINRLLRGLLSDKYQQSPYYSNSRRRDFRKIQYPPRQATESLAYPRDQNSVVVPIPPQYAQQPVEFISLIMKEPLDNLQIDARVVINERDGTIVMSGDVTIGAVIVSHENIVVEAGGNPAPVDRFVPLDLQGYETARLQALVDALNAIKVPSRDIIEIIKRIHKAGQLHGTLIVE